MPDTVEVTKAGEVIPVPGKGLVVLQALGADSLPPVTKVAASVPAVPPVPVPTAAAHESAPVEQSVVPPVAPAPKPRRRSAAAQKRPSAKQVPRPAADGEAEKS
jgi:hypothetical protein